jgi:hypothetical protein
MNTRTGIAAALLVLLGVAILINGCGCGNRNPQPATPKVVTAKIENITTTKDGKTVLKLDNGLEVQIQNGEVSNGMEYVTVSGEVLDEMLQAYFELRILNGGAPWATVEDMRTEMLEDDILRTGAGKGEWLIWDYIPEVIEQLSEKDKE